MKSSEVLPSAHAIVSKHERHQGVLEEAVGRLRSMGINHVTLQLECSDMTAHEQHFHP